MDAVKELRGRTAILTGASRGLGVHIARGLARKGIHLALAARSADALDGVRDEVRALGVRAVAVPTDLADPAQVDALAEAAERALGPADILVNNAGVEHTAPFDSYPLEKLTTAVTVNLLAAMRLARAVLPGMVARGRGHIVNMASLAGKIGLPYQTPYAATKAGLVMFTHSLRAELVDEPVGTSVICPGYVADAGMYARRAEERGSAPALLAPTTPARVVDAVITAIERDDAERIVNPLPMRPLTVLREIMPGIAPHVHKAVGSTGYSRRLATERSEAN